MDVESVSEELYGLPLDEFTPTRAVREKQARSDGGKRLAAQIHQLSKPNLVAWLANQLVREPANQLQPLLELGTRLREATATSSGEQLRDLSRQQRELVSALVQRAQRIANAAGRKVSADTARSLEDTFRAALADPDAAEALSGGRLTQGMQNSGLGPGQNERPVRAAKPTAATKPSRADGQGTPQRTRAKQDLDHARSAAVEALKAVQLAQDRLAAADRAATEVGERVERVRRELAEVLETHSEAESNQLRARAAFDRADRGARGAQQRLAEATDRFDRLAP